MSEPRYPTVDDLGREARIGTIALIPTVAILAGILLLVIGVPVEHPDSFGSGALFGAGAVGIYLAIDSLIERALVRSGLVRPRRHPGEEVGR